MCALLKTKNSLTTQHVVARESQSKYFSNNKYSFNLCSSVQSVVNSYFNLANASLIRRIASTIFSSLVA